jgi:hypothetical protein
MTTFAILLEERLFHGKNYEEPGAEMVTFMHWTITELWYYSGTLFTFTANIFWYTCKNEKQQRFVCVSFFGSTAAGRFCLSSLRWFPSCQQLVLPPQLRFKSCQQLV